MILSENTNCNSVLIFTINTPKNNKNGHVKRLDYAESETLIKQTSIHFYLPAFFVLLFFSRNFKVFVRLKPGFLARSQKYSKQYNNKNSHKRLTYVSDRRANVWVLKTGQCQRSKPRDPPVQPSCPHSSVVATCIFNCRTWRGRRDWCARFWKKVESICRYNRQELKWYVTVGPNSLTECGVACVLLLYSFGTFVMLDMNVPYDTQRQPIRT